MVETPISGDTWYYAVSGRRFGPMDANLLRQLIAGGQVAADTPVWKAGMADWVAADQVRELATAMARPPGPPPLPGTTGATGPYPPVYQQPVQPVVTPTGEPASEQKNLAVLAWAGGIIAGFIPSLIIWLINMEKKNWLADQAREAFNFQLTLLIAYFVAGFLCIVFIGFLLLPVIWIVALIFSILGAVKTGAGKDYRCALAIRFFR